jgi:hypothetical protein
MGRLSFLGTMRTTAPIRERDQQAGGMNFRIAAVVLLAAAITSLSACADDPVAWSDIRYSVGGSRDSASVTDSAESALPIPDAAACRNTVRIARSGKSFFAVWWSARGDSTAALVTSRSDDGGAWTRPVAADTTDAGRRGCSRPAPSVATDAETGYVHFAYFIEPTSGAGVFSIHSMDRDSSFHAPVAMVYGSRPSNTSIAAEGGKVAVAYEDPNSSRHQIVVALSRTMGHIFETRVPVSEENTDAVDPVVRLRGTKLEVSWIEKTSADSTSERHASRTGTWK